MAEKEYIERDTAIEIIDNYAKTITNDSIAVYQAIRDIVDVICPAADVVEVVRCKDCRYCSGNKCAGDQRNPDDYCSYGKRKEARDEN